MKRKTLTKFLVFLNTILIWGLFLFFVKRKISRDIIFGGILLFMNGGTFYKKFISPLNEKYKNKKHEKPEKYEKIDTISYKIIIITFILVILLAIYFVLIPFLNK